MTRTFIVLLFVSIVSSACSLSSHTILEVDSKVEEARANGLTCFPREAGRCADPSPLLDLGRTDIRSDRNHVTLIEIGEDALKLRIHLARAARHQIDVQNFILR